MWQFSQCQEDPGSDSEVSAVPSSQHIPFKDITQSSVAHLNQGLPLLPLFLKCTVHSWAILIHWCKNKQLNSYFGLQWHLLLEIIRIRVSSDLWVIEVGQALGSETLWQLAFDGDILYLVTQQFVVNVAGHGGLIHRKSLQGALHPAATKHKSSSLFFVSRED